MVSVAYSEAAVEVLDILKHTREEDVKKIPKKFIEFLEENKSQTYIANLDYTKTISEMKLKSKTQALLGLIYLKYWANEEERVAFEKRVKENEIKYQEKLRQKYNIDNLFNNKKTAVYPENIKEETQLQVLQKETLLQRIINKIKSIFRG